MRDSRFGGWLCLWTACWMAMLGCRTPPTATVPKPPPHVAAPGAALPTVSATGRPEIQIDAGDEDGSIIVQTPSGTPASKAVVTSPLSDGDTAALLRRLEPMPEHGDQSTAAPMRPPSAPPPRTGTIQPIAFAVPMGKPAAAAPTKSPPQTAMPLVPPQISPQGRVEKESEIRVQFDEPMIPVAKVGEVATPAVTITPAVAGSWRWIDTRLLQFTAAKRFPSATQYKVTVAAGARAISGATLEAPIEAAFETPPIELAGVWPGIMRPDSALVVQFDQAFDVEAIAKRLRVIDERGRQLAWKRVDLAAARALWAKNPYLEIDKADHRLNEMLAGPHLVIAPATAWPARAELQLELLPGAPSREGPLVSKRSTFQRFDIVAPLRVRGIQCGDVWEARRHGAPCHADGSLTIEFSNAIDPKSFRSKLVQIVGQPFQDHEVSSNTMTLQAPKQAGAAYAIAIGDGLHDVYGQPLVGPRDLSFRTIPRRAFSELMTSTEGLSVLDPRLATPLWRVTASSVAAIRVQLYKVEPHDYFAYADYEHGDRSVPPGRLVFDKSYAVGGRYYGQLDVDLSPALAGGLGHVIAVATAAPRPPAVPAPMHRASSWVQVTKLGVDARFDVEKLDAYVNDLAAHSFLRPVAQATASLVIDKTTQKLSRTTNAAGHARFELLPPSPTGHRTSRGLLLVQSGADSAFVAIDTQRKAVRRDAALWYVTDDRFTYKPGEKVYVKGWVRATHDGVNPDLAIPPASTAVGYRVDDARGNKIASGKATFSQQGGFDFDFALPPNVNLGTATIALTMDPASQWEHATYRHRIAVEEFRTPAFAVALNDDVSHAGATPLLVGESIEMSTSARYYAGGGLAGARVEWDARLATTSYRPPGWDRFSFEPSMPERYRSWGNAISVQQTATLTAASTANIVLGIAALPYAQPSVLEVDATVTDVDRMSIRATSRKILVHPSSYYVGLRLLPDDTLQTIVTDVDGNAVAGVSIDVELVGVLRSERKRDDAVVEDRQRCKPTSQSAPVPCNWKRKPGEYSYRAVATVADARGRKNVTVYTLPSWTWGDPAPSGFALVPDRKLYKPGDVAKISIKSDIVPAVALVAIARNGIVDEQRVTLAQPSTTIDVPITASFIQNVHVVAERISGKDSAKLAQLPDRTSATLELFVDREAARLAVMTRPLVSLVEPGTQATFEVEVRRDDRPQANAEVALMVVDEAVLSLSAGSHADPLRPFYRQFNAGVSTKSSIDLVEDGSERIGAKPGFMREKLTDDSLYMRGGTGWGTIGSGRYGTIGHGAGSGRGYGVGAVAARKDFRANAVFSPRLQTDAHGKARITVKMPDSLTRFRIVALAAANAHHFGKGESTITTQRTINARTIAPRFLTQGDTFSLPVVVQNLDREQRTVDVAVRAANLVASGPAGQRVTIPAGQRAEVRFAFATRTRGKAIVQTIVVAAPRGGSRAFADASNVEIPVYEPATTESFATYGVVDKDEAPGFEQLAIPADIFPEVGGVELEVASTQLQSLTDAYWYLQAYPYECAEQRSARMIATSAMADVLEAFATPGRPTKAQLAETRARDVRLLGKQQNRDGGWGYFGNMKSDPFVTSQVLTALALGPRADRLSNVGKQAVAFVQRESAALVGRLETALAKSEAARRDRADYPWVVGLAAATLTALASTGVDVRARAERLHVLATKLEAYPIDAKARLLAIVAGSPRAKVMRDELVRAITNATRQTAASANVTARYGDAERLLLVSTPKSTALALDALLREQPTHALVPKLARGVLDARKRGRWMSTQENLVALQSLRRYFDVYEKDTPQFTGKLWLGKAAYAEQSFAGRSTARGTAAIGWSALGAGTSHDLALVKQGPGRMYYRVGITYAPKQIDLPALDAGFVVRRSYAAVDNPSDVVKTADGYRIKLGAKVLVTVEALATTKRYNVAVVDPLPAGFESINENLATSERAVEVHHEWDHVSMRDNRSEAFSTELYEGSHLFAYTVRATTPGRFLAAPAKAEEMYSPETFGRSNGHVVVVE